MTCDGMGETNDFDLDLLIPDPSKSLYSPCIVPMVKKPGRWRRHIYEGVAKHVGFDIRQPWQELPAKACQALLWGTGDEHITFQWRYRGGVWKHGGTFEGIIPEMKQKYRNAKSPIIKRHLEKFMRLKPCSECHGQRLNPQARAARIGGHSIAEICALPVKDALVFFETLELERTEQLIAEEVLKEVVGRLTFLANVGLDYMTLDRKAPTLSGGESQRIRLAGQIGCGLVGVLYVLDEPSIGLHPRDNRQLLASLKQLRDMGNTVIVVEHDEDTMRAADLIVDFGPGPGIKGGRVTAVGAEEDLMAAEDSVTGAYLAGRRRIEVPKERRAVDTSTMTSKAAGSKKKSPQRKKTAKTTRKRSTRKKKRSTGSSTSQRKTRKKTSKRKSSKKKRT
jgi:excinuclease ABC subunit A